MTITVRAQTFVHPGCLQTKSDLDRMRTNVAAGTQPWLKGYNILAADPFSSISYVMNGPFANVDRGTSNANLIQFQNDCNAAYQQAIMWSITSNTVYRDKSLQIIKAWTAANTVFTGIAAQLVVGLSGFKMVNAAEIMRYNNSGLWSPIEIASTEKWFQTNYWPWLQPSGAPTGALDGNWGMAAIKCQIGIAVFCNNTNEFNSAVGLMTSGCSSILDSIMASGEETESGRDNGHWQLAIGDMAECAQVAYNQGSDLFAIGSNRLLAAFEYLAAYNLGNSVTYIPWKTCLTANNYNSISARDGSFRPIYEMAYNHYKSKGVTAPYTQQMANLIRPEGSVGGAQTGDSTGFGTILYTLDSSPAGLSAVASNGLVSLVWTAFPNGTNYNVKRAIISGGPYTTNTIIASTTATNYADTAVTNNTTYYYVVSAIDSQGETDNSGQVSAIPSILGQPTNVVATAGNARVALSWAAVVGATSYNVKRATASGGPYTTNTSLATVSYTDTNVVNDTPYYYVVSAVNASSQGPNSSQAFAIPQGGQFTPLIEDSFTTNSVTVTGRTPQEYTIGGRVYQLVAANSAYANSAGGGVANMGAQIGEAVSLASVGSYTKPAQFRIEAAFSEGTVGNGSPASPGRGVYLGFWSSIPATGDSYANMRGIFINPDTGNLVLWNGASSYTANAVQTNIYNGIWIVGSQSHKLSYEINTTTGNITNCLLDGTAYTWNPTTIFSGANTAFAGFGVSATSGTQAGQIDWWELMGSVAPATPTGLTATVASSTETDLSWIASAGAGSYNLKRSTTNGGPYAIIASQLVTTSYADSPPANGSTYFYVVSATNTWGESTNSAQASARPLPPLPGVPAGLTAVAGDGQVVLSWSATTNAVGYNIYNSTTPGNEATVVASNVSGLSITNTGLANGTLYYFVVTATNVAGESGVSDEVGARPVSLVTPKIVVGAGIGQIQFAWPQDHLGWRLQAQTNSLGNGLGTNWVTVTGSNGTNQVSIPVNANNGSVFFRLIYP